MDSFAQSELQNDRSKDGLPRGEITCCHCYPDWSGYWKCDWVLSGSCRLVLADYFMCDGRGWPFCIYYCDDCHSYSCKRAAAVSPLEALRYSDYQGKMKESSVLHRKITPASLAKMNLSRQKAKSTLTILSLSLGGVLVVLISTMLVSYDGVAEAEAGLSLSVNLTFSSTQINRGTLLVFLCLDCSKRIF